MLRLVASLFLGSILDECTNVGFFKVKIHFVVLVLFYAVLHEAELSQEAVSLALRVCG
jgi:hypothetical protein